MPLPDPMLANPGPLPTGRGWSFELKWDGFRAIVRSGDSYCVRSRRGWLMTEAARPVPRGSGDQHRPPLSEGAAPPASPDHFAVHALSSAAGRKECS